MLSPEERYDLIQGYFWDVPDYIVDGGKTYLIVRVGNVISDEPEEHKITMQDVADYFRNYTGNYFSTIRFLGKVSGDHRMMNHLAEMVAGYFKEVNPDGFRKTLKSVGLRAKF